MKLAVSISFLVVGYFLYLSAKYGRKAATGAMGRKLALHRQSANLAFLVTVGAVLLTEIFVRLNGGAHSKTLFWIHLGFALPLFLSLGVLRFWLTGLKNPVGHKPLAYFCLASYCGTLLTGLVLLWK